MTVNSDFSVAMHALVLLAHRGQALSSEVIAENVCTNRVRVRKVMAPLVRAGIAIAREGADGGYALARPGDRITLREVAEALDAHFVATGWKTGDVDCDCVVSSGMGAVLDALYDQLDEDCLGRLAGITVARVERELTSVQMSRDEKGTACATDLVAH